MQRTDRIFVAGHRGLVGSALVRDLTAHGFTNLVRRSRAELDLTDAPAVLAFYETERPQIVIIAAARVGGIKANAEAPVEFLLENLKLQNSLIEGAARTGVEKLLFLGSSCIYPKHAPQPIPESALLTGPLEPTNDAYAIAKIAGIRLCQAYAQQCGRRFFSAMPTNLYGPGDNFDLGKSHVLPALLRKAHEAKLAGARTMSVWGSGEPRREMLHVDDLAAACRFLLERDDGRDFVNVGSGEEVTIRELAMLVSEAVGFEGELVFDPSQPDGTPRKLLDSSRLRALGWAPRISLRAGIRQTYEWFLAHEASARGRRRERAPKRPATRRPPMQ